MIIRKIEMKDAQAILELKEALDRENTTMLYEPEERDHSTEEQWEWIHETKKEHHNVVFVAHKEGETELLGYIEILRSPLSRIRHRGSIVIGVREKAKNNKIGTSLMKHAIQEAKDLGLTRLELTVMATNRAAMALYHNVGFQVEGIRTQAIMVNDHVIDEFYMALVFSKDRRRHE